MGHPSAVKRADVVLLLSRRFNAFQLHGGEVVLGAVQFAGKGASIRTSAAEQAFAAVGLVFFYFKGDEYLPRFRVFFLLLSHNFLNNILNIFQLVLEPEFQVVCNTYPVGTMPYTAPWNSVKLCCVSDRRELVAIRDAHDGLHVFKSSEPVLSGLVEHLSPLCGSLFVLSL